MNNPLEILKAIKNPQQFAMNLIKKNNNPMFNNLIDMANKNDIEGLTQFGRNLFNQQNRNFDEELQEFINNLK